jgi:acyl carrier protein
MATIQDRIRSIVASKLGITEDEITPDKNLTNDLGADSLDVVELSMELEREFNLKFEDTDTEKIQTVEDLYKLIEEYTSK